MSTEPTKRHWRSHIRISVRGLIVLVLIVGGWLGWMVRGAQVQREAVETIRRAGGSVQYDWELFRGLTDPNAKPPAPDWLVRLVGVDYFGNVVRVVLSRPGHLWQHARAGIERCDSGQRGSLAHLETLDVTHTSLDDAGLAHLEPLRRLKQLGMVKTNVTDAGLIHLKGMSALRWLGLAYTNVTEVGIQDLRRSLPALEVVH